ncbi:quinoprotein relay system zinc metallohydrolase 2 [Xanthobacter aminoxidans]|uniref:quinoprotein relay system zinc metallohydrolase 2 n=1 Tax=Xanthobacter aminoxidans TaxID=186280 RepID=UPI002022E7F2|nr:quinoprotein relay system zinc metallohydrolase 2 [Xanthobacter aminoxidans]MCL8381445.1 quinoprotein relay system zinc metallohydrolase 2 [Xanthobacter aminoxidans]
MERSGAHGCKPQTVPRVAAGAALAALLVGAIPTAAQAQPEPFAVSEIAPGVFVHQAPYALALPKNLGFVGNAGFVVGKDAVAVIDTGGSKAAGEALKAAIRARTALPIRYVINTHMHPDHVLGDAAFVGPGVTFIGHHNLPEALSARASSYLSATERLIGPEAAEGTQVILPDETVDKVRSIDLGERPLRLEAWPTAHTATDLTVFDEKTSTWFLGDLLFLGHVPALDGKALGWIALLEEMKRRPAARVVPGHGPASAPWPDAAAPTERYLKRLVAGVRATVKAGGTMAEAARAAGREEAPDWKLFDDFNARNATSAYHELEWE